MSQYLSNILHRILNLFGIGNHKYYKVEYGAPYDNYSVKERINDAGKEYIQEKIDDVKDDLKYKAQSKIRNVKNKIDNKIDDAIDNKINEIIK